MQAHGWSQEFALRALIGYAQFLQLKDVFEDWDGTQLIPSTHVDKMWLQHILDNRNYRQDCAILCNPENEICRDPDSLLDTQTLQQCVDRTKVALTARFGDQVYQQVWDSFPASAPAHDDNETDGAMDESLEDYSRDDGDEEEDGNETHDGDDEEDETETREKERITISIRDMYGHVLEFSMRKETRMSVLFENYAARRSVQSTALRFFTHGVKMHYDDTPAMWKLESGDLIYCIEA